VSGRGQGRQPPQAVARSASLEAGRSPVYFNTVAPRWPGSFATVTFEELAPRKLERQRRGRQDHTTSPSARSGVRRTPQPASTASRRNVSWRAQRPSC